jgi:hypothetical protein
MPALTLNECGRACKLSQITKNPIHELPRDLPNEPNGFYSRFKASTSCSGLLCDLALRSRCKTWCSLVQGDICTIVQLCGAITFRKFNTTIIHTREKDSTVRFITFSNSKVKNKTEKYNMYYHYTVVLNQFYPFSVDNPLIETINNTPQPNPQGKNKI